MSFLIILLSIVSSAVFSQTGDWKLAKEKKGVKVYTREVQGAKMLESRGVCMIDASAEKLLSTIFDYAHYKEWAPDCIEARIVDRPNPNVIISYSINGAPWPVSDRDIVVRNTVSRKADGSILVRMAAIEGMVPEIKNAVRISEFNGTWLFEPADGGMTKVTYQALLDPAGSIPAWVANMVAEDTPYTLLDNLRSFISN